MQGLLVSCPWRETSALIVAEILDRLNLRALDSMTGEFFQLAQTEES
jgi:hypothetical protein